MELFDGQPTGVSIRECARQLGVSDTAIRKAIKAQRCSTLADGSVDVEAVRAGMNMSANPLRGGQRQAGVPGGPQTQATVSGADARADAAPPAGPKIGSENQTALMAARLSTEQSRAEREAIELAQLKGTVVELAPISRAVVDAMVAARGEIMSLPDRLTPIVTPETDTGKVYAAIETEVQRICAALQLKLANLAALPASGA